MFTSYIVHLGFIFLVCKFKKEKNIFKKKKVLHRQDHAKKSKKTQQTQTHNTTYTLLGTQVQNAIINDENAN